MVVLIHPRARVEVEDPILPVLYADSKKKPSLRGYLKDQKVGERATLSLEAMDKLDRMYGLITREEVEGLEEGDEEETDVLVEDDGPTGTVYLLQAGSLYNIGMTRETVEGRVQDLQGEADQEIQVLHTIESREPEKLVAYLHKRFARKRQKGEWFGLSKKDVSGLLAMKSTASDSEA
jgi:hypothetical protein